MARRFVGCWCSLIALVVVVGSASAQDRTLSDLYGRAVHCYFGSDYQGAFDELSTAIQAGMRDPRVYYFRGLAAAQLGRDADADYTLGAKLEFASAEGSYGINDALERVQGSQRERIERFRTAAREAATRREQRRLAVRYEQLRRAEAEVLWKPKQPLPTNLIPLPAPSASDPADPFVSGTAFTGGAVVERQPGGAGAPPAPGTPPAAEPEVPAAVADPFATPLDDQPKTQQPDPFGTPAPAGEQPAEEMPAEAPQAEAEDPFARPAPAAADPFGAPSGGRSPAAGILKVLGKMFSGQNDDRDPFSETEPAADQPKAPAETPSGPAAAANPQKPAAPGEKKPHDKDPFADDPFK